MNQVPTLSIVMLVFAGAESAAQWNTSSPSQLQLVRHLLDQSRYDKDVRPVLQNHSPVKVTIRMNLYQILDVNEPNQNIVLYVWVTQTWDDEFLGWDPAAFGGISSIVLPYDRIWLPDTYLYNSLEMTRESVERWISVILVTKPPSPSVALDTEAREKTWTSKSPPQGRVSKQRAASPPLSAEIQFRYPAIYRFSCRMYILYFPFDIQNCTMTFGSWTYDSTGIDFFAANERVLNESYIANEEWSVISFFTERQVVQYACCPHPFVLIKMHLIIQRKPLYYLVNLVIPTAIITAVAVIGFFMPASSNGERAEKVNLGITTLLAMSILLLMVTDQMPTTSDFVPLIGWFFLTIIVLISLGTAITSFIILLQQQAHYGRTVPTFVRRIFFDCMAPMLLMGLPEDLKDEDDDKSGKVDEMQMSSTYDMANSYDPNGLSEPLMSRTLVSSDGQGHRVVRGSQQRIRGSTGFEDFTPPSSPARPVERSLERALGKILADLGEMRETVSAASAEGRRELEWEFLAALLDRLFLILFLAGIVIVTMAFVLIGYSTEQSLYVRERDSAI